MHDEHDERDRPLMTASELARDLRVSSASVRRWARTGALPAARVGRGWRFDPNVQLPDLAKSRRGR